MKEATVFPGPEDRLVGSFLTTFLLEERFRTLEGVNEVEKILVGWHIRFRLCVLLPLKHHIGVELELNY